MERSAVAVEFLQALKDMDAETLIHSKGAVLSSSTDVGDREAAKSFGVKGYIENHLQLKNCNPSFS